MTAYPVIMKKSDSEFFLFVQQQKICKANSAKEALAVMVCAYWVFDLQFNPCLKNTLSLLCVLCVIEVKRSITLQRLLNKLL